MTNYHQQETLYQAQSRAMHGARVYVIMQDARLAARLSFHYSRSNQSCTAYLWIEGAGISKGVARGGGYDRMTHAAYKAAANPAPLTLSGIDGMKERRDAILTALSHDDGYDWQWHLHEAGFTVYSAI